MASSLTPAHVKSSLSLVNSMTKCTAQWQDCIGLLEGLPIVKGGCTAVSVFLVTMTNLFCPAQKNLVPLCRSASIVGHDRFKAEHFQHAVLSTRATRSCTCISARLASFAFWVQSWFGRIRSLKYTSWGASCCMAL